MPEKALLVVLDGFGLRDATEGNAIKAARTPNLDRLFREASVTTLATSGEEVGLPAGQMGNSEVGHMNMGAGRIVYQMLTKIDKSIRDGEFGTNEALVAAARAARASGGKLHLMGLLSDGGVHSHQNHLHALLALAQRELLGPGQVLVHVFTDGRDTSPTGGLAYVKALEAEAARLATARVGATEGGRGKAKTTVVTGISEKAQGDAHTLNVPPVARVATVSGRYYAMDRDKRWDRTRRAWDAIVHGRAPVVPSATEALALSYAKGVTDEFVEPVVVMRGYTGVKDEDAVVFFNFRPDRTRQLTRAFREEGFKEFDAGPRPRVHYATMTKYDDTFVGIPFAFAEDRPRETLGETVAAAGLRQVRIAETEKYPHVTYFFNGGEERQFPGEERMMVPSPRDVPTYDHKPEMSARGVTDAAEKTLRAGEHHLVVMNYANCDMVGHTGDLAATVRAVEVVDECLGRVLDAARAGGYHVFLTADHGNAEEMTNPDGTPQTAHTTLPVPLAHLPPPGVPKRPLKHGILADVAPTVLDAMGLPKPAAMTRSSLLG